MMEKSKRSHIPNVMGVISIVRTECWCGMEEPSRTRVNERVGGIRIKLWQPRFVQVVKRETTKRIFRDGTPALYTTYGE